MVYLRSTEEGKESKGRPGTQKGKVLETRENEARRIIAGKEALQKPWEAQCKEGEKPPAENGGTRTMMKKRSLSQYALRETNKGRGKSNE